MRKPLLIWRPSYLDLSLRAKCEGKEDEHSSPKVCDRKILTDSGFETKRLSNAGLPEYLKDNSVAQESTGDEEKQTKKQSKEIPDRCDLSFNYKRHLSREFL